MAESTLKGDGSWLQTRARLLVACAGVPETTMRAAEAHGPADWQGLATAMDSMFVAGGSQLAHRRFWFTRDLKLGGLSPLEALGQPDGIDRVASLARTIVRAGLRPVR
jgi:hypothetical protein